MWTYLYLYIYTILYHIWSFSDSLGYSFKEIGWLSQHWRVRSDDALLPAQDIRRTHRPIIGWWSTEAFRRFVWLSASVCRGYYLGHTLTHDGSMVLVYMLLYANMTGVYSMVNVTIYASTMDPSWVKVCLGGPDDLLLSWWMLLTRHTIRPHHLLHWLEQGGKGMRHPKGYPWVSMFWILPELETGIVLGYWRKLNMLAMIKIDRVFFPWNFPNSAI